jgi:hypothetical protein
MTPEEIEVIVAKANDNHSRIEEAKVPLDVVKEIVAENDIVWGVWHDPRQPGNAGLSVIKGHEKLSLIADGTRPESIKLDAIPCLEAEQAESLRLMLGDGRAENRKS